MTALLNQFIEHMFFKKRNSKTVIKEINHLIYTCAGKNTIGLVIYINECDFKRLKMVCDVSDVDATLYGIPLKIKRSGAPMICSG